MRHYTNRFIPLPQLACPPQTSQCNLLRLRGTLASHRLGTWQNAFKALLINVKQESCKRYAQARVISSTDTREELLFKSRLRKLRLVLFFFVCLFVCLFVCCCFFVAVFFFFWVKSIQVHCTLLTLIDRTDAGVFNWGRGAT